MKSVAMLVVDCCFSNLYGLPHSTDFSRTAVVLDKFLEGNSVPLLHPHCDHSTGKGKVLSGLQGLPPYSPGASYRVVLDGITEKPWWWLFCFVLVCAHFFHFSCFQSLPVAAVGLRVRVMKKDLPSTMSSNKTLWWRVLRPATQCITVSPKSSW